MIQERWEKKPLTDVAYIQTGIAKGAKKLKNPVELPYLRVANVQDGYLDLSCIKTIEVETDQIERYLLKVGDVLLTEGGDFDKLGRGAVWKGQIENSVHQNHVFVVRPKSDVLLSDFLSLLTGSPYGKKYFQKCSKQSTNLASINSTQLKKFPVILPPLPEQKAITSLLSTWDLAIEKAERLIAAKEKGFTALTQQLIHGCTDGLREVHLRDICEPVTRKNSVNELNVLTTSAQHGLVSQLDYYKKSVSAEDVRGYYLLKNGEFAYNRSSSNGYPYGAIKRLEDYPQGVLSTLYLCFSLKEDASCDSDFMAHAFEAGLLNKQLMGVCQEGARSHGLLNIPKSDFFGLKMSLPPVGKQKKIAALLSTAQQEIDLLKKQTDAFRRQKRGLMQKLLTGEWRVKVGEDENGDATD